RHPRGGGAGGAGGRPEASRPLAAPKRRGHGPASGELLELAVEELERAAVVERHAVLAGAVRGGQPVRDDVPVTAVPGPRRVARCDAACRRLRDLLPPQARAGPSAAAPVSTASPRSVLAVSAILPGSTCHMSVVMVSPGKTTPEKRTSKDLRRSGWLSHHAAS